MSGIFGVFNRLQEPVSLYDAQRMGDLLAHRGPDGLSILPNDYVTLGHTMLNTTPESLQEKLPSYLIDLRCGITSDARIDNREQLAKQLNLNERYLQTCTDSELVMHSYRKWGVDCFKYLLGDFSIVIWDEEKKQLVCARDILGVKPFYYYLSKKKFLFCSEIKPIIAFPGVTRRPNTGMIGEYLCANFVSQTETIFKDVCRLAPAHYLVVTKEKSVSCRYWTPHYQVLRRYKKESDYIEGFNEIITEAVKCRLRSHLPVSAELSGGLDSSSIISTVSRLVEKGEARQIAAYSCVFPGMVCDEQGYIGSVSNRLGVSVQYVDCSVPPFQDLDAMARESCVLPDPPNITISQQLLQAVRDSGSRVVLTGIGGDEWFSGSDFPYLDLLLQGKIIDCCKELRLHAHNSWKRTLKCLGASLLWPILPYSVRLQICKLIKMRTSLPQWLSDDFAKTNELVLRLSPAFEQADSRHMALSNMISLFNNGLESRVLETNDRYRATFQIEARHPFLDQRVVEFGFSLPDDMRRRMGWSKFIMRLAAENRLPQSVVWRKGKNEFSVLFYKTFEKHKLELEDLDAIAAQGWIDKRVCWREIEHHIKLCEKNANVSFPGLWPIWFALATNIWYRSIDG